MPKRYLVFKWAVYTAAALFLLLLQATVLDPIQAAGVSPFLAPMIAAVAASYEGSLGGPLFAMGLGLLLDLSGGGGGFYTFFFTLAALLAALLAENFLSPGFLCSLVSTAVLYAVTLLGRLAVLWPQGADPLAVLWTGAREFLVTLPLLLLVFPLLRWVYRKTTVEY